VTALLYNEDAELSVVGAVLRSESAVDAVLEHISADDFYRGDLATIFRTAVGLWGKGLPVDPVAVHARLEQTGDLAAAGGKARIHEVAQMVTATSNAAHHARIVKDMATLRGLGAAGAEITRLGAEPHGAETGELVDRAMKIVYDLAYTRSTSDFTHIESLLTESFERIRHLNEAGADVTGVPTGFRELDSLTSGFQRGNLVIVAARPSMGKSALALNMAQSLAVHHRIPVALFTLEMSRSEVTQRMMSAQASVESQALRTGRLRPDDWPRLTAACSTLGQAPIWVDDTAAITLMEIRSKARRLKIREPNLGLVIVDYLQLMTADGRQENRVQEVSQISRALKVLARELDVPVVALSQLSRAVEARTDKRPVLSDLRESGSIEQDADIVAFVYRDDYYNPESDQKGVAELIVAKHRNGPTDTIRLAWLRRYARFSDLAVGAA
jgi:replicative DNA helicase